MFLKEGMVNQFLYISTIVGVLLKATIEKIPHFRRHKQIGGDFYLIFYYLDQFLLFGDLERVLPHYHFVHHDTDGPDVNLLVILFTLKDLRADIERSATECGPQFVVLMD
jgi:hypothetical protein